jgi:hypothetical protein
MNGCQVDLVNGAHQSFAGAVFLAQLSSTHEGVL